MISGLWVQADNKHHLTDGPSSSGALKLSVKPTEDHTLPMQTLKLWENSDCLSFLSVDTERQKKHDDCVLTLRTLYILTYATSSGVHSDTSTSAGSHSVC